jgi:hypothetical protein
MLEQANKPTVLVERDDGACDNGLDDTLGARKLLRRDGDHAHRKVKVEAEPRQATAYLPFSSYCHPEAEIGRDVVPDAQGAQKGVLADD